MPDLTRREVEADPLTAAAVRSPDLVTRSPAPRRPGAAPRPEPAPAVAASADKTPTPGLLAVSRATRIYAARLDPEGNTAR
jgi:hypothetical protein